MNWTESYRILMHEMGVEPFGCPVCGKDCKGTFRMMLHRRCV